MKPLKPLTPLATRRKPPVPTPARRGSNVTGHSYDTGSGDLIVTFGSGKSYRYAGVPVKVASQFDEAESRGKFLHQNIIGKYEGGPWED